MRSPFRQFAAAPLMTALLLVACGTGDPLTTPLGGGGGGGGSGGVVPRLGHVIVVVEENTDYSSVIGSASMPYLNSLAQQYALATNYHANTHPSIGNYFMLTVGRIVSNDDNYSSVVTDDNIVRRLIADRRTWKSYAEDLPSVGYVGDDVGQYARKHNVIALLSDVVNDPGQRNNLVPFTQFAADLASNSLPDYAFVVPNRCNDAHDCPVGTADAWLKANIDPLVKNPQFQRDGLLVIVFDEADSDNTDGGGRVACVIVSPKAKKGYQSATPYQHQSVLRLTGEALGLTTLPNEATTAPDMGEFFQP
jgi:hypothetical protein